MNQLTFGVFLLLPSVVLCFVVLTTFYETAKAYLAISWIPLALFLVFRLLIEMDCGSSFQRLDLGLLLEAVRWTSLAQGLIGVGVVAAAVSGKKNWTVPAIATVITILPFFLGK